MSQKPSVLVVDDESGILDTLRILLRNEGFEVTTAQGGKAGLEQIRSGTHDIVLVFDEVVTGFRFAYGGAQEAYGVTPDLATYGKIVDLDLPRGRLEDLGHDGIAVRDTVASARGWSVGDKVPVRFALTGDQQFTVAALVVAVTTAAGLGGAVLYGLTRGKPTAADAPAIRAT